METENDTEFDLDEDLFGFESANEAFGVSAGDEEDLEAIFAEFQAQEDAEAAARDEARKASPDEEPVAQTSAEPAATNISVHEVEPALPMEAATPRASGLAHSSGGSVFASKSVLLILLSVTVLNGFVALVTLRNTASMRDSVLQAQRELDDTATTLRTEARDEALKYLGATTPIVPPDAKNHPTFARAQEHIAAGEYAMARQRIYALLSVVDRLEESNRATVEARAHFLIAEATHLETLTRMEGAE